MDRSGVILRHLGIWTALSLLPLSLLVSCQRSSNVNRIPTVAFVRPLASSAVYGDTVVLELRAADSDGSVASVALTVDGEPLATLTQEPYITEWRPAAPGSYTLRARAVDNLEAASLPAQLTITVAAEQALLSVDISGAGVVSSTPAGIDCGEICEAAFDVGAEVALRAAPAPGFALGSWQGCDAQGPSCLLTVQGESAVQATFVAGVTLTADVVLEAGASGVIRLDGELCAPSCAVAPGRSVTLSAVAGADSSFVGWGGACADALGSTCALTLEQDTVVSAAFSYTPGRLPLNVTLQGQGGGQVISDPAGISCPADCHKSFSVGAIVTLTALPQAGSLFAGWDGACADAGAPSCTVTLEQVTELSARFDPLRLTIEPADSRVVVGGELALSASASGLSPDQLVWEASAGRLTSDGLSATLSAPTVPGVVTVAVSYGSARAEARITVFEGVAETFMIVALPDTQNYLCSLCPASSNKWHPAIFRAQTQWIVDNQDRLKIALVTHLGDVVETADRYIEWEEADRAIRTLDGRVSYSVTIGDHDYYPEEYRDPSIPLNTRYFKEFFGASRYRNYSWYLGTPSHSLSRDLSHAQRFSAGGREFLHIALEWEAPDEALSWAASVIEQHPGIPTIVSTHAYLSNIKQRRENWKEAKLKDGSPDPRSNSAEDVYRKLIREHPQIFMVLGAHYHNRAKNLDIDDEDGEWHQVSKNRAGLDVYEMLSNYQDFKNGGDGWLRFIEFIPGGGVGGLDRIQMRTYSPTRNQYRTGSYSKFHFDLSFAERFDR
jgi:hypothetical protein